MERGSKRSVEGQTLKTGAAYNAAFDYSKLTATDISIVSESFEKFLLQYSPETGKILDIYVQGDDEHFIDLSNTFLYLKLRVRKKDGTKLATDSKTAVANCIFTSMFSDMEILIQNVPVTNNSDIFPYSAYINQSKSFKQ